MKKSLLALAVVAGFSGVSFAQGSLEAPLTVDQVIANGLDANVANTYVEGYIVGYINSGVSPNTYHFEIGKDPINSNILLASSSQEDTKDACIAVQLPSGAVRTALNLQAHPENLGHKVIIKGTNVKYCGMPGIKETSEYQWVGEAPVPSESKTYGTAEAPISCAELLAIPCVGTNYAYLQGYIVGAIPDGGMDLSKAVFGTTGVAKTMVLVGPSADCKNVSLCVPVALPAGEIRDAINLGDNAGNLGKALMVKGSYEKYFGVGGIKSVTEYKLGEGGGSGDTPVQPGDNDVVYDKDVKTAACGFTFENNETNDGKYVWSIDAKYGLKASAFVAGTRYVTSAYAVSPVLDLTERQAPVTVDFSQAGNFFTGTFLDAVSVVVREEGATEWVVVPGLVAPEKDSWAFAPVSTLNLDSYAGKKIQLGFHYTSTEAIAGTWEIDNLVVKAASSSSSVEAVEVVEGEAVYFNLQGVRVANPENGLYIKVVNGKSQKVIVK